MASKYEGSLPSPAAQRIAHAKGAWRKRSITSPCSSAERPAHRSFWRARRPQPAAAPPCAKSAPWLALRPQPPPRACPPRCLPCRSACCHFRRQQSVMCRPQSWDCHVYCQCEAPPSRPPCRCNCGSARRRSPPTLVRASGSRVCPRLGSLGTGEDARAEMDEKRIRWGAEMPKRMGRSARRPAIRISGKPNQFRPNPRLSSSVGLTCIPATSQVSYLRVESPSITFHYLPLPSITCG